MKSFNNNDEIIGVDFIFAEIRNKNTRIFVAVIYRTNACNTTNTLRLFKLLIEISSEYNEVIIMGDWNIDIMNGREQLKTLNDYFEVINDNCPTHSWPGATPTLIDIVLTKNPTRIEYFFHYNECHSRNTS